MGVAGRIGPVLVAALALTGQFTASPALAASRGEIKGRVINQATGRSATGVKVTLTRADPNGTGRETVTRTTRADGRYSFRNLPTGPRYVYALDALFQDGIFPGKALQLPDDTKKPPVFDTKLRVWPTTTEPRVIQVPRDDVFVTHQEGSVTLIESVTIFNTSQRAYIGRGRAGGGDAATPSIAFALPDAVVRDDRGAPRVQLLPSDIDLPTLLPSEFGFAATSAIPPGRHKVTFTYAVSGGGGTFDLSRTALYPTMTLEVYAAEPLDVRSNRLGGAGEVTVGEERYARYTSEGAIEAGDPIQIVVVAEAGSSRGLILGATGLGIVLLAAISFAALRPRRGRTTRDRSAPHRPPRQEPALRDRQTILTAIAQLDLDHEARAISDEEWETRRDALKKRLDDDPGAVPS